MLKELKNIHLIFVLQVLNFYVDVHILSNGYIAQEQLQPRQWRPVEMVSLLKIIIYCKVWREWWKVCTREKVMSGIAKGVRAVTVR